MKYKFIISTLGLALLLAGCTRSANEMQKDCASVDIRISVEAFAGELETKTSLDGSCFESGDMIRFKITCPLSTYHELGETWGGYYTITAPSGNATGWVSGTYGSYEAQATTYIYSAQNTTGNRIFVVGDYRYVRPSNFFQADQSKLENFKKSDVVWAQTIRQTGAREVHFNFKHKVAKLDITVDDTNLGTPLNSTAVLTLAGMPDIDGAEIVIGDYYADESYEDYNYNYRQKASCSYENNGKVIGVEVIDEANKRSKVYAMTGNPSPAGGTYNSTVFGTVPNTATYTAYNAGSKHYLLYVPACELDNKATIWLRDGDRRYSMELDQKRFEEGVCYRLKLNLGQSSTPDPSNP